jgi:hypothetical protein
MENLKIHLFESGKSKPNQVITIPLSKLNVGKQLLPTKAKTALEKEGIDIGQLSDLTSKNISKGALIEVESGKEKLVIAVE